MRHKNVLSRVVVISSVALLALACDPQQKKSNNKTNKQANNKTDKTTTKVDQKKPDPKNLRDNDGPVFSARWNRGAIGWLKIPSGQNTTPLAVEDMKVDVIVHGRMARTRVTQVFRNHTSRRTQGTYSFTLPQDASLSRLAMTVGDKLVEGELVEREKARMIYESIVRKRKDPALLEWQGGNRFSTQVFPIEPNATKTVVIAYESLLPEHHGKVKYQYNLPKLDGLAKDSALGNFQFKLQSEDGQAIKTNATYSAKINQRDGRGGDVVYGAKNFKPGGPIEVMFDLEHAKNGLNASYLEKNDTRYFLADFTPNLPKFNKANTQPLVVALDTSAGLGQPVVTRASLMAKNLIASASADTKIVVITGDHITRPCNNTPLDREAALACLTNLTAGGATDLNALLLDATKAAKALGQNANILLLTDGVASLGEMDADLIEANVAKALPKTSALHTVAIGHAPNEDGLRRLSRKLRGQSLRMTPNEDAKQAVARINDIITEPLLVDLTVETSNDDALNITPNTPQNIARGETIAIIGQLKKDTSLKLTGMYMGKPWSQTLELKAKGGAQNTLLPKFWARRHIDVLQKQDAPRAQIVKLSKDMGVLSPFTSFLVLESKEAFEKYQIQRRQEEARLAAEKAKKQREALAKKDPKPSTIKFADEEKVEEEDKSSEDQSESKPSERAAPQAIGNLKKGSKSLGDFLAQRPKPKKVPSPSKRRPPADRPSGIMDAKVMVEKESARAPAPRVKRKKSKRKIARNGLMGLGTRGTGKGGGGIGNIFGNADGKDSISAGRGSGGFGLGASKNQYGKKSNRTKAKVRLGIPQIQGDINKNIVRRVFRRYANQMRYCYEKELVKNPALRGKIQPKIILGSSGRVESTSIVSNSTGNSNISNCIVKRIKRMRFPRPSGAVVIVYPMTFTSHNMGSITSPLAGGALALARIKELESKKKDLKRAERAELLELYVSQKQNTKAKTYFKTLVALIPKNQMPVGQLEILRTPQTRAYFSQAFIEGFSARLKQSDPPSSDLISSYLAAIARAKDLTSFQNALNAKHLKNEDTPTILTQFKMHKFDKGSDLLMAHLAKSLKPIEIYNLLYAEHTKEGFEILKQVVKDPKANRDHFNTFANLGIRLNKVSETISSTIFACENAKLSSNDCIQLMARYKTLKVDDKSIKALQASLFKLFEKDFNDNQKQRAEDMANHRLIKRAVMLLKKMGKTEEAARVLSEMVEFEPHDYESRINYGRSLVSEKQIELGCAQYATAVQLNPAKRNTFRTMMNLRRSWPKQAKVVRECIVTGVSRLPVKRAVSIILTWDTPGNDVDLHIREAGKHHVSFRKRESPNGGLLYYDITNGYGPEIYVLGSGPAGKYPVSLIYYRGSQRNVTGTLTILRDAGSPEESRKDIRFTLPFSSTVKEYPISQFILTERDKAGGTTKFKNP